MKSTHEYPVPTLPWWRQRRTTFVALLVILAVGAYFRLVGLTTWDGDTYQHPDERFLIFTTANLAVPPSWGDYWRSSCLVDGVFASPKNPGEAPDRLEPTVASGCNTLNPRNYNWSRFFVYGPLPTTLNRLVGEWRQLTAADELRNSGRMLSTLFDLGSIVLVFLIGCRLYGRGVGLLAALLLALNVLHIQHAHFFTVDTFSAFFTLLAVYWAVRVAQGEGLLAYVALGFSIGGGMAVRLTLASLGLLAIIATAYVILARPTPKTRRTLRISWQMDEGRTPRNLAVPMLGNYVLNRLALLVLAGAVTLLAFRILQPDAFVGNSFWDIYPEPRFLDNMSSISKTISGEVDMPPSHQWAGRDSWWYPWRNMILWGMGPAMGLTAWIGWALAGWQLFGRRRTEHLLPWFWVGFWFAWQGAQFVLTQRYMLPIYGLLAIFAAWALVALWRWQAAYNPVPWRTTISMRQLAPLVPLLVVTATLLWAYAFTRIYTRPHSRIEASRWIYQHIPPGATVTSEEWDDALPASVDGYTHNRVVGIATKPYWEDLPQKFITGPSSNELGLIDQLTVADYVIFTSNRVYDSISRLPTRYPATMRYYHYIFNGELGFELVADIGSYPTLFGIPIYDQTAEEAFSVYDHPRVLIFKKTPDFSRERAIQLLTENIVWDEIYRLKPIQSDKAPTALRLTEEQWQQQRSAGTWSELFKPASFFNQVPLLSWLVVLELLGLAAFALIWRRLPGLADGGFALAKMLAILLVAYAAWMLGSLNLMPFTPSTLWSCALLLVAAGGFAAWRDWPALRAFVKERRSAIMCAEGLFLVAFLAMVLVRYLNPDLWHPARGGEKPMDIAFLNAVLRSSSFPPYDPWFAGGYLNYYYFGFVIVGALIHLSGVVPSIAYNLAVPTLFALTAVGAWGVAYNLVAPSRPTQAASTARTGRMRSERQALATGLLAALFVTVSGNLAQTIWYLNGYAAQNAARPEWAFWDATRLIEGTINEFPFFTFLFADLHAHMIVLPLTMLALGLLAGLVRAERPGWPARTLLAWLLVVFCVGTMRATNTWEYPTYQLLALATLALITIRRRQRGADLATLARFALPIAILLYLGPTLLFWPFVRSFGTDYQGVERWHDAISPLSDWLRISGVWLAILSVAGLALVRRVVRVPWAVLLGVLLAFAAILAFGVRSDLPALVVLAPLLVAALALGLSLLLAVSQPPAPTEPFALEMAAKKQPALASVSLATLWAILLAGTALALAVAVELVRVQGDIGRMNTVFKFGLQIWTLAGIASALALNWLWRESRGWRTPLRWSWDVASALLIGSTLVYPLTATPARIGDRMGPATPRTLDGLAFAEQATMDESGQRFDLRGDFEAMRWLQENVDGTPVVMEGHTEAYRWGARFSIYTGFPTVLGWPWHETQQRSVVEVSPIITVRQQAIRDFYGGGDAGIMRAVLQRYGVEYVVVGGFEEALFPGTRQRMSALAQTGAMRLVHDGPTQVYAVVNELVGPLLVLHAPVAVQAPPMRTAVDLRLDRPVDQLRAVDEYAWNEGVRTSLGATILWLLFFYGLALLGLPLATLAFGHWRDGGWLWARPLGLLLLGYAVWQPVSARLWDYTFWSLLLGLLLVLALNGLVLYIFRRTVLLEPQAWFPALRGWFNRHWRAILGGEALFLVAFGLNLTLRAYNPDLWHPIFGGEKPWEFGFVNAILRSPQMPPYDPYFSGGYLNYYYYGLFLVSLPMKATGVLPAMGFNLALATLFALLIGGAFAIVAQVTRRVGYGLFGALAIGVIGNIAGTIAISGEVSSLARGIGPVIAALREGGIATLGSRLGDWFWGPTRVIPFTINEFPWFSFLFGDLHPHTIALPLTLLAIALIWNLATTFQPTTTYAATVKLSDLEAFRATLLLLPLVLGTLAVTNSWDFPTYGLLAALALIGAAYRARQPLRQLGMRTLLALALPVLGLLLFLPFFQHFRAFVRGIGLVAEPTGIASYLLVNGQFVALLAPLLWLMALRVLRHRTREIPASTAPSLSLGFVPTARAGQLLPTNPISLLRAGLVALPLVLVLLIALAPGEALRILLAILFAICAGLLLERRMSAAAWFVALLAGMAWAVSLGIEFIFIRDHLAGGDWQRMNTVFKFGLQIWVLLAIAAACGLPLLVAALRRTTMLAQVVAVALATLLLATTLVYPLAGTASRLATRFEGNYTPTLDGLSFLRSASFCLNAEQPVAPDPTCGSNQTRVALRYDAEAINWLLANVKGTPIVLQTEREFYRAYGIRIAANTGLPTVVDGLHAGEQRPPEEVGERVADVRTIYSTSDNGEALRLLAKYGVGYVYIGPIERATYPAEGLAKFDGMNGIYVTLAYQNEGVKIFDVNDNVRQFIAPEDLARIPTPQEVLAAQGQAGPNAEPLPNVPVPTVPAASAAPAPDLAGLEAQVAANPSDAGTAFALGQRYRDLGRFDDAARVLQQAAQANPTDIGLHHLWGDILTSARRYDEAAAAYQQAITVEPSWGNYNKLGSALVLWGRLDEAEPILLQAVTADPSQADPHYFLGQLYQLRDLKDRALASYNEYLRLAQPGAQHWDDAQIQVALLNKQ